MGSLYYGSSSEPIQIPDSLLAHVKVVLTTKFRRKERLTLSLVTPGSSQGGRTTLWLDPSIPLRFVFDSADAPALDGTLLRQLADAANSVRGLVIELDSVEQQRALEAPVLAAVG
ncbi:hypothetical protein BCL57_000817 [Agromyces flavus]|uniref:DUF7882 domain-containing protein n=1 Tax=Agromyces flavus TaxID=589382 RepID=A0A1H1YFL5_9MICO|nr:hypothetical protein [Agromyces flavus]MCP2366675.1 hypothetical protein [Agromyces flavus]GGI45150.1 hypothetical protein GCM10010932_08180 [Agromyces flavus]SDT20194.1 hypothetical protein SAMN04489721_2750 [Agromyces flavus]